MSAWKALRKLGRRRPLKRPRLDSQQRPLDPQELLRENDQLRDENERLREEVVKSGKQIADRDRQIADLERQLAGRKKDSTNSSKPPSSDGPAAARRVKPSRCRGRRKPGGQKGHPGCHRELQPLERVDEIVAVLPSDCRHCGQALPQQIEQAETRGEVHRHQVTALAALAGAHHRVSVP